MGFEGGFLGVAHDRSQKNGFELASVGGEVAVGLAEDGQDLGHFQAEGAFRVGKGGAVALGLCSWPSAVWAEIWTRRPASGAPSPARRIVPVIQKPSLPIRSTMAAPLK